MRGYNSFGSYFFNGKQINFLISSLVWYKYNIIPHNYLLWVAVHAFLFSHSKTRSQLLATVCLFCSFHSFNFLVMLLGHLDHSFDTCSLWQFLRRKIMELKKPPNTFFEGLRPPEMHLVMPLVYNSIFSRSRIPMWVLPSLLFISPERQNDAWC